MVVGIFFKSEEKNTCGKNKREMEGVVGQYRPAELKFALVKHRFCGGGGGGISKLEQQLKDKNVKCVILGVTKKEDISKLEQQLKDKNVKYIILGVTEEEEEGKIKKKMVYDIMSPIESFLWESATWYDKERKKMDEENREFQSIVVPMLDMPWSDQQTVHFSEWDNFKARSARELIKNVVIQHNINSFFEPDTQEQKQRGQRRRRHHVKNKHKRQDKVNKNF